MAGRRGNGSFLTRTKIHISTYLSIRREELGKSQEKAELRSWLASVCALLTESELRELLIHLYGDIKPDTTALEVLTNERLIDIKTSSNGLKIKDNGLNGHMRLVQD
jgi:hypothetical protein